MGLLTWKVNKARNKIHIPKIKRNASIVIAMLVLCISSVLIYKLVVDYTGSSDLANTIILMMVATLLCIEVFGDGYLWNY